MCKEINVQKLLILFSLLLALSGCSSTDIKKDIADNIFEEITGVKMSRDASQCYEIKKECANGNYEEWVQKDGRKGGACN